MDKIIIIGAGAAGLMAAKELSIHNEVIVLEASSRIGGRIHSEQLKGFSRIIETGPEFIHGHLPITLQLLMQGNIDYVAVNGEFYRKQKGKWVEQDEIVEDWDELMQKMKSASMEMTLYDFLEQNFPGEKYAALRLHARRFAEGFDIADPHKVSVQALYKEWSNEEHQSFRIPQGYNSLVSFLQQESEKQGCRFFTGHAVTEIHWKKNQVAVLTSNGKHFEANKIIVAVPLSVLRNPSDRLSIHFNPMPDNYIEAMQQVGEGDVLKLVIEFDSAFWKKGMGFMLTDEAFSTWWTQSPDQTPILTGWIGGPRASQYLDQSEEMILEKAFQSLSAVFEIPIEELRQRIKAARAFKWKNAYSYITPGTPVARKLLNKPILDTIFFAGEGIYEGESQGTVEAALASGREAAEKCKSDSHRM